MPPKKKICFPPHEALLYISWWVWTLVSNAASVITHVGLILSLYNPLYGTVFSPSRLLWRRSMTSSLALSPLLCPANSPLPHSVLPPSLYPTLSIFLTHMFHIPLSLFIIIFFPLPIFSTLYSLFHYLPLTISFIIKVRYVTPIEALPLLAIWQNPWNWFFLCFIALLAKSFLSWWRNFIKWYFAKIFLVGSRIF